MPAPFIDTNIILRFLVEDPLKSKTKPWARVFKFFQKIEKAETAVSLAELVVFETFFVLTSYYKIPKRVAAEKMISITGLTGFVMEDKPAVLACLKLLSETGIDLVDAYLTTKSKKAGLDGIYSLDNELAKQGLTLLSF